ncbi:hypothetical protein BCA37_11840 [Mycobacterium sp. djl-10]|nr:hypothetical protein BCA37_11840 [Mycobacterium sp. djl-10]
MTTNEHPAPAPWTRQKCIDEAPEDLGRLGVVVAGDCLSSTTTALRWARPVAEQRGLTLTCVEISSTQAVPSLIRLSASASLLVVGASPTLPVGRSGHASTLTHMVTHAGCSVVVVPQDHHTRPDAPIVVGISDASPPEEYAIGTAFDAASRHRVPLVAVHCWNEPGALGLPSVNWSPIEWADHSERERAVVAEQLAGFQERYPDVSVQRILRNDRTASVLIPLARAAQLVIVSAGDDPTGRTALRDAALPALLRHADVPVLVARRPGARSAAR